MTSGPETTDVQLARRLRQHSPDALAEAFRLHGAAVAAHARARSGDPAMADDITQEVFLALWRDPDRFEPSRGTLRTFLLTLARHRTVDTYRSEQARLRRQDRVVAEAEVAVATVDVVVAGDEAARLRQALRRLPFEEHLAIDLAYFGQHTYREVAQILGKPEGTIKGRIRAGLRRLRTSPDLVRDFASVAEARALA